MGAKAAAHPILVVRSIAAFTTCHSKVTFRMSCSIEGRVEAALEPLLLEALGDTPNARRPVLVEHGDEEHEAHRVAILREASQNAKPRSSSAPRARPPRLARRLVLEWRRGPC